MIQIMHKIQLNMDKIQIKNNWVNHMYSNNNNMSNSTIRYCNTDNRYLPL